MQAGRCDGCMYTAKRKTIAEAMLGDKFLNECFTDMPDNIKS